MTPLLLLAPLAAASSVLDTGLPDFDLTYAQARDMIDAIDVAGVSLDHAHGSILDALELPAGTALTDAMETLGAAGGARFRVDTTGGVPTLVPTDALPDAIWEALVVTSRAAATAGASLEIQRELLGGARALVDAANDHKATLGANMLHDAGLEPTKMPKVSRITRENAAAISAIPSDIDARIHEFDSFLTTIRDIPQP